MKSITKMRKIKNFIKQEFKKVQPEFSRLLRFFYSTKMNQSDTGIPDIDQSPSSILRNKKTQ
jgi:hypothetical protein